MNEEPVDGLERDLREVLVRAVDRIACLEPDDALPPALREDPARLCGIARELGELRCRPLEHGHAAGEVERLLREEPRDARVRLVGRAEAVLGLVLAVVRVGLLDLEDGQSAAALVGERDAVSARRGVDGEAHGQRPRKATRRGASPRRRGRSRPCP